MSKILKFPEIEKIEEAACAWIARLDAGELSESEEQSLRAWLQADERHQTVLFEVATLMDQMSVVSTLNRLLPLSEVTMATPVNPRRWRANLAALGMAASVLIAAVLFSVSGVLLKPDYHTEIGEIRGVVMEDGSRVTINTDSSLSVRFGSRERRLVLDRGEAMFQVVHDPSRPFIVEVDGYDIRAVGTAFNVSLAGDEVEIIVTEGVVEVISVAGPSTFLRGNQKSPAAQPRSQLAAGDQMKISGEAVTTESIDASEVNARLSWRKGELVFRGEPLEWVVAEIARYSPVNITFGDEEIRRIPIGGVFETGDVDNLVDLLEYGIGVHVERTADGDIELTRDASSED